MSALRTADTTAQQLLKTSPASIDTLQQLVVLFCCPWFPMVPSMSKDYNHIWTNPKQSMGLVYLPTLEEILHHLTCMSPCKEWDIYHINWCRISSINRISVLGWGALPCFPLSTHHAFCMYCSASEQSKSEIRALRIFKLKSQSSEHPWTPKPWKMKVLNPAIHIITPKNKDSCGFPWYCQELNITLQLCLGCVKSF